VPATRIELRTLPEYMPPEKHLCKKYSLHQPAQNPGKRKTLLLRRKIKIKPEKFLNLSSFTLLF
jgi:hypothetical protein